MLRQKTLLLAAIGLCFAQNLLAGQHYNAWFRGTFSVSAGKKFKIDNELQHRRQNGFENADMFDKNLMFSFRNWVHYQHNEDVKFSISPFAYFLNYKPIKKQEDENRFPANEIRFSVAIEMQHAIFKKFYIVDRTAIEYRLFQNNQTDILRLRNRLGFRYDFSEKIKLSVFDELLFNVSGTKLEHFFDHDRIGLNLEYKISNNLKLDVGYLHITRLPLQSADKQHENNIFINITYQLHKRNKSSKMLRSQQ